MKSVDRLALAAMTAYQRHLSPRKGFCCAHRVQHAFVSELTLNYKVHPLVVVSVTYDMYNSSSDSLLAKDGGWNGSMRNHIFGIRVTSLLPF